MTRHQILVKLTEKSSGGKGKEVAEADHVGIGHVSSQSDFQVVTFEALTNERRRTYCADLHLEQNLSGGAVQALEQKDRKMQAQEKNMNMSDQWF